VTRSGHLAPVELPDTFRDLGEVDVAAIATALTPLSERFWEIEDERKENAFSVFHHTRHLILRFIDDADDPRSWYERPLWPMLRPTVQPVMKRAVEPYAFSAPVFPKVMFARLAAHAVVDRHVDAARGNQLSHKIHVPIVSHPDTVFEIDGTVRHLAVGRAYEVNNVKPHGVSNPTEVDRVHLIFEVFDDAA
jgi:hypothetical protein